jgi:putative transposase
MRTVDTQNARTFYRRKLPHWHPEGATIFVTWRLKDSLPKSALERIEETRKLLAKEIAKPGETIDDRKVRHFKKLFALADDLLDRATDGPLWLKQASVASMVEAALLSRYQDLYALWAYVVMANHVHVFLQPKPDSSLSESRSVPLSEITKRLKGYTSREANKILERTGEAFWQIESFDHWARDEAEFYRIISYIEQNPVKAGLTSRPEDWLWSSARERIRRGWSEVRALT